MSALRILWPTSVKWLRTAAELVNCRDGVGNVKKTSVEHFEGCLRPYIQDRLGISHDKGKTK